MTKIIKNKKTLFSLITLILTVMLFVATFLNPNSKTSDAASTSVSLQSNQNFTISVFDRTTGEESVDYTRLNLNLGADTGISFIYNWSNVNKIKFNYDADAGTTPPAKYKTEGDASSEYYDLSISIEYLKAYKDNKLFYQSNLVTAENVYKTTAFGANSYKNLEESIKNYVYDIDIGETGVTNGITTQFKEWGIYRFKLLINDQQTYSDFFVIEPTMELSNIPKISSSPTSSKSSLHNDYICTIENDEYKYVDSSRITWYVSGYSDDGILYVLVNEDKDLDKFKDKNYQGLWKDDNYPYDRKGLTFRFDDRGTAGSWEVWCEYNYYGSTEEPLVSKSLKFTTGSSISYSTAIGIFAAVFVVALGVTVIFAVRRSKKDKIY